MTVEAIESLKSMLGCKYCGSLLINDLGLFLRSAKLLS